MPDRSVMPARKPTNWVAGAVAAAAAVAIAAGGAGVASAAEAGSSGSLDVSPSRILADGVYKVGFDVQPGTYRTAGAWPGSLLPCSWTRIETLPLGGINAIERGVSYGPVTVTIGPDDDGFETAGCRGWNPVVEPGADGGTSGGSLDFGSLSTGSLGS